MHHSCVNCRVFKQTLKSAGGNLTERHACRRGIFEWSVPVRCGKENGYSIWSSTTENSSHIWWRTRCLTVEDWLTPPFTDPTKATKSCVVLGWIKHCQEVMWWIIIAPNWNGRLGDRWWRLSIWQRSKWWYRHRLWTIWCIVVNNVDNPTPVYLHVISCNLNSTVITNLLLIDTV